jgi:3-hydroxybutyrate dehydrogenase/3-oxoacyl-[acyl-carrier protein] reductase
MINGRSEAKGVQALEEIGAGDRAAFLAGDVQQQADVEALIDATVERFGRLDILVANAGGSGGFALVGDMSDEAWNEALNWNLNHLFWAARRSLKHFAAQRSGRIITISSVEGKQAKKAAVCHYITNKSAMNSLTQAIAFEYGPMGITANAICPGAIETDLMKDAGPAAAESMGMTYEAFLQSYADESSIKRLNTVEEVAAVATLLASEVGGGINGALINVDGGTSCW